MRTVPIEVTLKGLTEWRPVDEESLFTSRYAIVTLSSDPVDAAKELCDTDLRDRTADYAIILCGARTLTDWKYDYPDARPKDAPKIIKSLLAHPSILWAADELMNYMWLMPHWRECCAEYKYRQRKSHPSVRIDRLVDASISGIQHMPTRTTAASPPPQCLPDVYRVPSSSIHFRKWDNAFIAWQNFYIHERYRTAKWTRRPVPHWFTQEASSWDAEIFLNTQKALLV